MKDFLDTKGKADRRRSMMHCVGVRCTHQHAESVGRAAQENR